LKKHYLIFLILYFINYDCKAQDIPPAAEQQLENLTDAEQAETEDDSYLQQLDYFRGNPLNLNTADVADLRELRILTDLQIANLLSYRRILGNFIHIYEIQAVPTWDVQTIRKILPFITIASPVSVRDNLASWFKGGEHSLLLRYAQVLEKQKGFEASTSGSKYKGGPQKVFFRYRYRYKNQLQFGLVGDKDAGEQFFKGAQNKGFDFYSVHFFARKIGVIQALAVGDFTVNMGQGLVQWQSMAFKKSGDITGIKRQSATLRPYNSAGEFNFHRGVGITIRKKNIESTFFGSWRKISANLSTDTSNYGDYVSSFLMSGNHRTSSEIANRNNLKQLSFGGNLRYSGNRWHVAVNTVAYNFSAPVQKRNEPYNAFALSGRNWYNISIDCSFTYKNFHLFGEAAADKGFHKAILSGLLVSVDQKVDVSVVHRAIAMDYQAVNANAFTENTYPTNENGIYFGVTAKPAMAWRIDLYSDHYKFPWLKYQVDAPSSGRDFLAQLTYTPGRQFEIYSRFRAEAKHLNKKEYSANTNALAEIPKVNWRVHASYRISNSVILRQRVEVTWYDKNENTREEGYLMFADVLYKPLMRPFSAVARLQYFETDGYNSRLYAYENDVLYSYSIPVSYDKGHRYYFTLNYDVSKKLAFWLRWSQSIYSEKDTIGSGLDGISGNRRSEIKLQVRYVF
jgi:DNA uptake protein ComE-like DNA-binding protein